MDPDAALAKVRAYAEKVDSYWRDDEGNYRFPPQPGGRKADCSDEAEDAEQLVAYWQGLDEWLSNGGMLPEAWTQAERRSHKSAGAGDAGRWQGAIESVQVQADSDATQTIPLTKAGFNGDGTFTGLVVPVKGYRIGGDVDPDDEQWEVTRRSSNCPLSGWIRGVALFPEPDVVVTPQMLVAEYVAASHGEVDPDGLLAHLRRAGFSFTVEGADGD